MFRCSLITKLQAILLMEADFNGMKKQIYGIRMLVNAHKYYLMLEKIYSKWNRMADDGILTKVLANNIIRQMWRSAGIALVDADNCYNRIARAIASLVFQAFGVLGTKAKSMLTTIQEIKFFLRTSFRDSTDFASSNVRSKLKDFARGTGHPWQVEQSSVFA
jgi:hypothetical protein